MVAAHPDDEVVGATAPLAEWSGVTLVHVTDGAPRNMYDCARHGFSTHEAYARARRSELNAALAEGGVRADCVEMRVADQQAAYRMAEIATGLAAVFREIKPDLILTHAYEGGHPDHDACAFAVQAAARMGASEFSRLWEFACYHAADGQLHTNEFPQSAGAIMSMHLTPRQRDRKGRMLACFTTQRETLSLFGTAVERFRPAPAYDFTQAPHPGMLYYERHDWGATGERFRGEAQYAERELGLGSRR